MSNVKSELGPYGIVQRRVLGLVSAMAFALYAALSTYADRESMECWPSIKTLAKDLGVHETTVQRAMRELEEKGIISIERRKRDDGSNYPNLYTVAVVPDQGERGVAQALPTGSAGAIITIPKNNTTNVNSNHKPRAKKGEGKLVRKGVVRLSDGHFAPILGPKHGPDPLPPTAEDWSELNRRIGKPAPKEDRD